jgi:protein-tyrosine phosphatase
MINVLFVCLGNICRSPAAEGLLRHMAKNDPIFRDLRIQSCGLGNWHIGQLPDLRIQEASQRRGVILTSRAQQFQKDFFDSFDYILAADHEVLNTLYQHTKTSEQKAKLHLITSFSSSYKDQEIPDPYYGNDASFELVLDMLDDACEGLLQHIKTTLK